jgi:hypothetical protein
MRVPRGHSALRGPSATARVAAKGLQLHNLEASLPYATGYSGREDPQPDQPHLALRAAEETVRKAL